MNEFYSRDFLFAPDGGKGYYEVKACIQESCCTNEKQPIVAVLLAKYGEYTSFVSGIKDLKYLEKFAKDLLNAIKQAKHLGGINEC